MTKKSKEIVTVTVRVKVPFDSYDKESMNKKATAQIVRDIKGQLRDHLFIGLYVKKGDNGVYIEDCSHQIAVTVIDTKRVKGK